MKSNLTLIGLVSLAGLLAAVSTAKAQSAASTNSVQVFHADGTAATLSELPASLAAKLKNAGGKSDQPQSLDTAEQAISDAKAYAKASNMIAAEQAITNLNRSKANTAAWHLETASRLIEAARQLAHEGNPTAVSGLANLSLQHLDQVVSSTKDNKVKAQAKAQSAFIHLRYSGDAASAMADYQAALQFDPKDRASQAALARLQAADATLRARVKHYNP